ncbi:hypothetical protein F5884DRAFT_762401 [Xylogone sp. PMI_703]|nr:hypothetical protein F5884DRAFT_762401 [Xylogone sp. PMI_703]
MAYDAVEQHDRNDDDDYSDSDYEHRRPSTSTAQSPVSPSGAPQLPLAGLFLSDEKPSIKDVVQSIASRATSNASKKNKKKYAMVEDDDYEEYARHSPELARDAAAPQPDRIGSISSSISRPQAQRVPATATAAAHDGSVTSPLSPISPSKPKPPASSPPSAPILRTASGRSVALRHPTPDLQTLQGAYTSNIEQLERSAEQLSTTSSVEDAIRDLHQELKRSDSRKSAKLKAAIASRQLPEIVTRARKVSNASSIVEVNSAARSGGFSPAAFIMSPRGSLSNVNRVPSVSRSSRYGSRPEPELEGRPLDSFVGSPQHATPTVLSRSSSMAERGENQHDTASNHDIFGALDKPVDLDKPAGYYERPLDLDEDVAVARHSQAWSEQDRPDTGVSGTTFEQAQKMFADFDGVHVARKPHATFDLPEEEEDDEAGPSRRRAASGSMSTMARPKSYADPNTGQQMVYYPAPVPMMLNLPQKLSKNPSTAARNKRRSQVLSSIPTAARQSAVWLPDVLENEDDARLREDDEAMNQEYLAQHQRTTMGGRRLTTDVQHLPAHLRASLFFELPEANQVVELKDQSAVATLDSILDASAHAPVSAFTDHAFAGHLGAEVYGTDRPKTNRTSTQPLTHERKRTSSFNLLSRRRSSGDLLDTPQQRRSTMSTGIERNKLTKSPAIDDNDAYDNQDSTPLAVGDLHTRAVEGEFDQAVEDGADDDEVFHGPPTTLLAELQLRKQQQRQRTRPITSAYPNGMHSTLLQLDTVAQIEQNSRRQKRVNLAWEDPAAEEDDADEDEDVPLGVLFKNNAPVVAQDRPLGLLERRDLEDNEPLSRRRDRLQAGQPKNRASTMMNLPAPHLDLEEDENETLGQRVRRLKQQAQEMEATDNSLLPKARPVSGDFKSELMSQFGDHEAKPDSKGKGISESPPEEEETLGQRRKRLQAEREAQARAGGAAAESGPTLAQRRSMANILSAHPAPHNRNPSVARPVTGLLGLHEQQSMQRASTMFNINTQAFNNLQGPLIDHRAPLQQPRASGFKGGLYNDGRGGIPQYQNPYGNAGVPAGGFIPQFPQPSLGFGAYNPGLMPFSNPYTGVGMTGNPQAGGYGAPGMNMQMNPLASMNMGMLQPPLSQGQIDMVERWRQSIV